MKPSEKKVETSTYSQNGKGTEYDKSGSTLTGVVYKLKNDERPSQTNLKFEREGL